MTPKEFADEMRKCESDDIEAQHSEADDLMTHLLREHGYEEGVNVFDSMTKWYS